MLSGPRRVVLALALATAAIGLGAASSLLVEADNEARLRALPVERRRALAAELGRFDLMDRRERDALLRFDAQLAGLPREARSRDLGLLRRYHLWHQGLTDEQAQALADASLPMRVAMIGQLRQDERQGPGAARRDDAAWTLSPSFNPLTFSEEAFQIRVWPHLPPKQREILEKLPHDPQRMIRLGGMAGKLAPSVAYRDVLPDGGELRSQLLEHIAKRKNAELQKLLTEARRRQDEHFRKEPPPAVEPAELHRFEGTFPPWIRERIVALPPDAARWRLAILHHLAFDAPIADAKPRPKPPAPAPQPGKAARSPESPKPAKAKAKGAT